jgi:GNAT superfamily N-acetyltransferase
MEILLTQSPTEEDLNTISQGIKSYNQNHLPDAVVFEPDTRFAVFAKNDKNIVVGGIRANAYWNYCIIELLWLSDEVRGKGTGSQLMQQAEKFAKEIGIEYIRTETVSFQAKPFYEKLGYTVYGELKDLPKGCTTYCLVKKL